MSEEVEELEDLDLVRPGPSPMKLLIIFGVLFVLSNGVWGALFFLQGDSAQAATPGEQSKAQEADPDAPSIPEDELNKPGPVVDMDPYVVNLNEANGGHYLRATIKLEIDREETREAVDMRKVMIRDEFLSILSSKQMRELQTIEDRTKLREELLAAARGVTSRRAIQAVYFTEFLTQ
ncbi:MAG: flagellar basal body-associated FliL family protein [Myxococcota bacterium]